MDPQTNKLQYSVNGADGPFTDTGVNLPDGYSSMITGMEETDSYIVITFGDNDYYFPRLSTNTFAIVSGKVFFNAEDTKAIAIELDGMVSSMVANKPKGWEVSLSKGSGLNVTAPALEMVVTEEEDWETGDIIKDTTYVAANGGDMGGVIEVWVVLEDGKTVVGQLAVAIAEAPAKITFDAEGNVTYKFPVSDTGYGYEAPEFVLFGAVKAENLDKEAIFANIETFLMTYSAEGVQSNWGENETITLPIEELVGEEPQIGSAYVFWAIHKANRIGTNPDGSNIWDLGAADLQLVYLTPTKVSADFVQGPFTLTANVKAEGASGFYAYAGAKSNWEIVLSAIEEGNVTFDKLFAGLDMVKLSYIDSNEAVIDYTTWGVPEEELEYYRNELYPEQEFVLAVIPAVPSKVTADYTADDMIVFETSTSAMKVGGASSVTFGDPTKLTYNQIQFSATLNNVYRGLYRAFTAAEISELGLTSDEKIEEYAVENYLDSFDYFPSGMSNYTINKQQLSDGETVTFVAITFDEDGSYAISKTTATTKKINYAADGAITVKAISVDRTNAANPVVTFEVIGADKVIVGESIRSGWAEDATKLNNTAVNVLSTFPAIYGSYQSKTASVVNGKAEITLSQASYYAYWAVTAVTGTTAEDVQLLKPFFLSQEELQALPDTVKEEASEEESAQ